MKAAYESLNPTSESSFLYRRFSLPKFDAPYHFHPEIELTLIVKGKGKRLVGSQIDNYEAGDLVLLGENVPHCWLSENTVDDENVKENTVTPQRDEAKGIMDEGNPEIIGKESLLNSDAAQSIVIQFKKDFLGDVFFEKMEFKKIKNLLGKAQSGLVITGDTRDILVEKMKEMESENPYYRLMILINILQQIAHSKDTQIIDNQPLTVKLNQHDAEKINKIYAYIMEHYTSEISLENVAKQAFMTPPAFCRYFKKITRKTLVEVVVEYRIKHACQLLSSTDKSISDICFESGFGNISYFNKQFKEMMRETPLGYRKMFLG
jgi:AraC-like DNA-binding protein/quercetin dioxygenase-like cupin family protein